MKTRLSKKKNSLSTARTEMALGKETATAQAAQAAQDDWIAVGEVVGVFGLHGEVKVQPLTSFTERFAETPTLFVGQDHTPYTLLGAHMHKQQVIMQFDGVTTIEAAETLRGQTLAIPAEQLRALPADQFYLHDVIGLRVQHINGQPLGVVKDILATGGTDLFVVRNSETGEEVLLPAVKAFIKQIDVAAGILTVDPIPGLFDDQAETAL